MRHIAAVGIALSLSLAGCIGGFVTTTPGPGEGVVIEGYQCRARTDTTVFEDTFGVRSTTEERIACQNGEDYACDDRDRAACVANVGTILAAIPKDDTPPAD